MDESCTECCTDEPDSPILYLANCFGHVAFCLSTKLLMYMRLQKEYKFDIVGKDNSEIGLGWCWLA